MVHAPLHGADTPLTGGEQRCCAGRVREGVCGSSVTRFSEARSVHRHHDRHASRPALHTASGRSVAAPPPFPAPDSSESTREARDQHQAVSAGRFCSRLYRQFGQQPCPCLTQAVIHLVWNWCLHGSAHTGARAAAAATPRTVDGGARGSRQMEQQAASSPPPPAASALERTGLNSFVTRRHASGSALGPLSRACSAMSSS